MAARATVPFVIHNGNHWTEWNAIWSNIIRVISKSDAERAARSASSIWNHQYDFRPKFLDTNFNDHFIIAILKSQNPVSTNTLSI